MEPKALTSVDWQNIVHAVNLFWLFAACFVVAALSFGLSHAILASMVMTGQAPARAGNVRPVLYLISAITFVLAIFFVYRAFSVALPTIWQIYPNWWV